ncbi:MAG: hypothetical protein IJ689_02590 [Alphaproteobacteria bacterium]|nr:hypothetical protein [Alphaproteobacteria bacterium]
MKNYILLLGVAGVALGSYCAYAGNSATMTVTARIEYDVSLTLEGNTMDFGTIYIDPTNIDGGDIYYSESGAITRKDAYIVNASAVTPMNFTANITDPSACISATTMCGGLSLSNEGQAYVVGASVKSGNFCQLKIKYTGTENNFKIIPIACYFDAPKAVMFGDHSDTLTISYTAS